MSYKLNKTDGSLLIELVDGQIDQTSTDLTLIGRNYTGFGEFYNENLIKMLENFASTSAPSTPLTGQLWFDTSEGRLKVYDGFGFKSNGPIVSNVEPQMVAGDIWIDNQSNKLYFFDGTDLQLVGPIYSAAQGLSGFEVDTITDTSSIGRTVLKLFIGGTLVAVMSNVDFTPVSSQTIVGITGQIRKGINIIEEETFRVFGLSDAAERLITDQIDAVTGERIRKSASQFLPSDANGETTGSLTIKNNSGITLGTRGQTQINIAGNFLNIQNTNTNNSMRFRLLNSVDDYFDGLVITGDTRRVGVNMDQSELPTKTLDVNGDARIRGDLIVEGANTTIETSTLSVDDYTIEIGHADTVLTLNTAVKPTTADSLTVGEVISQANSSAQGTFKSINDDRTVITLEPLNGLFTTNSADTLTSATQGPLLQEIDEGSSVYATSVAQRTDVTADGAGIFVKSTPNSFSSTDKYIKWVNDTINGTNWEISDNVNLPTGKTYKINDDEILSSTTLGSNIVNSNLQNLGILTQLRVHNSMTLDELAGIPTIKTTGVGLTIDSASSITIANQKRIVNLGNPINDQDASTKFYTDTKVRSEPLSLFLDVTGMPDGSFGTQADQILDFVEFMYPAEFKVLGTIARLYTVEYSGRVDGVNINEAMTKEWINVDWKNLIDGGDISVTRSSNNELQPPGDGSNQQILEDIAFQSEVNGTVGLNVDRRKRWYKVQDINGVNTWVEVPEEQATQTE
jgi:hypothetical protein